MRILWAGSKAVSLLLKKLHLNRFERILFGIALYLAVLILAVRIGEITVVWHLYHAR